MGLNISKGNGFMVLEKRRPSKERKREDHRAEWRITKGYGKVGDECQGGRNQPKTKYI